MKVEITAEDLSRYPWRDVFHKTKPAVATEFAKAFSSLRNECLNIRDGRGGAVYSFLCRICEWPKPTKAAEVIVGVPDGSEERSSKDEDEELEEMFSPGELDLAFELLGSTVDPEFRALLADIIAELRDDDIESVQIAAEAYLSALERVPVDAENWMGRCGFLIRGLKLAARAGWGTLLERYGKIAQPLVEEGNPVNWGISERSVLMGEMLKCGIGDHIGNALLLEQFSDKTKPLYGEWYLWLAARLYRAANKCDEANRMDLRYAESLLTCADDQIRKHPSWKWSAAIRNVGRALRALRRAGVSKNRIEETRRLLRVLLRGARTPDEGKMVSLLNNLQPDEASEVLRAATLAQAAFTNEKIRELSDAIGETEEAEALNEYLEELVYSSCPTSWYGWAEEMRSVVGWEYFDTLRSDCWEVPIADVLLGSERGDGSRASSLWYCLDFSLEQERLGWNRSIYFKTEDIQEADLVEFIRNWRRDFLKELVAKQSIPDPSKDATRPDRSVVGNAACAKTDPDAPEASARVITNIASEENDFTTINIENLMLLVANRLAEALQNQGESVVVDASSHPEAILDLDPEEMDESQIVTETMGILQGMEGGEDLTLEMMKVINQKDLTTDQLEMTLIEMMQTAMD